MAKSYVKPLLIGGGVLIALMLAATKQKEIRVAIASGLRRIMDEANKLVFKMQLPGYAREYADLILRVSEEQNVDPFVLFGVGDRETLWGSTRAYVNQTGDATPRCRSAAQVARYPGLYTVVGTCPDGSQRVMPGDGLGWGRGIAQIDWEQQYPWPQNNNWRDDYTNLTRGAQLLKGHLDYFAATPDSRPIVIRDPALAKKLRVEPGEFVDPRPLWGEDLIQAALSAYNAGRGNVLIAVAAGEPPDALTTGGDYSRDTYARGEALASRYEQAGGTSTAAV